MSAADTARSTSLGRALVERGDDRRVGGIHDVDQRSGTADGTAVDPVGRGRRGNGVFVEEAGKEPCVLRSCRQGTPVAARHPCLRPMIHVTPLIRGAPWSLRRPTTAVPAAGALLCSLSCRGQGEQRGRSGRQLRGRRRERQVLDALAADVEAGRSAALVLRGDAGIGKSAPAGPSGGPCLPAPRRTRGGCRVGDGAAVRGTAPAVRPRSLDRLDRLPPPQREALATAFGMSDGPPPDRFLVGIAVLGLLTDGPPSSRCSASWTTRSGSTGSPRRPWASRGAADARRTPGPGVRHP